MKTNRNLTILDPYNDEHVLRNEITTCYFDVISSCNLACPTCPVGNSESQSGAHISIDLFEKILGKLKKDFLHLNTLNLFNWTEPLLYKKLPDLVELVNKFGFECYLSANLNNIDNLEEVIKKEPFHLRISVSGFSQEVYEKGHRLGNIDVVKKNMKTLSELIKKYQNKTKVTVIYLKYKHNIDEISLMRDYSIDLGFSFEEFWAFLMPVEKILQYIDTPETIDPITNNIIKLLGFEPKENLEFVKSFRTNKCTLLENQIVLNAKGEIQQCCGTLESIGNYLEMSPKEIQEKRHNSKLCEKCMDKGIHVYFTSKWDDDDFKPISPN